jgi:four helix bundle protein
MQNDKSKFKKEFIKRLVDFSITILRLTDKAKNRGVSWAIIDQLIRSATSIGANVVEARASSSKKDYIKFFEIALKSANETLYWLILLKEATPGPKEEMDKIYIEAKEISKILGSSVLTLKGKK